MVRHLPQNSDHLGRSSDQNQIEYIEAEDVEEQSSATINDDNEFSPQPSTSSRDVAMTVAPVANCLSLYGSSVADRTSQLSRGLVSSSSIGSVDDAMRISRFGAYQDVQGGPSSSDLSTFRAPLRISNSREADARSPRPSSEPVAGPSGLQHLFLQNARSPSFATHSPSSPMSPSDNYVVSSSTEPMEGLCSIPRTRCPDADDDVDTTVHSTTNEASLVLKNNDEASNDSSGSFTDGNNEPDGISSTSTYITASSDCEGLGGSGLSLSWQLAGPVNTSEAEYINIRNMSEAPPGSLVMICPEENRAMSVMDMCNVLSSSSHEERQFSPENQFHDTSERGPIDDASHEGPFSDSLGGDNSLIPGNDRVQVNSGANDLLPEDHLQAVDDSRHNSFQQNVSFVEPNFRETSTDQTESDDQRLVVSQVHVNGDSRSQDVKFWVFGKDVTWESQDKNKSLSSQSSNMDLDSVGMDEQLKASNSTFLVDDRGDTSETKWVAPEGSMLRRQLLCGSQSPSYHYWCETCQSFYMEECMCRSVQKIVDRSIPSRAWLSLPNEYLTIKEIPPIVDTRVYGVFTRKVIPKNFQFGPFEGVLQNMDILDRKATSSSPDFILSVESHTGHFFNLDMSDEDTSNWMRFVRRADTPVLHNISLIQKRGFLYLVTRRRVENGEELRVWYSDVYAQRRGLLASKVVSSVEEECNETKDENVDRSSVCCVGGCNVCRKDQAEFSDSVQEIHLKLIHMESPHTGLSTEEERMLYDETFSDPPTNTLITSLTTGQEDGQVFNEEDSTSQSDDKENDKVVFKSVNDDKRSTEENDEKDKEDGKGVICAPSAEDDQSIFFAKCHKDGVLFYKKKIKSEEENTKSKITIVENNKWPKKPFKCTVCYKTFTTKERHNLHQAVHGAEELKPLQCGICYKRFLNNSALACHIKVHSEEKRCFECPICRVEFDTIVNLKEHVYSHAENGVYTCPYCDKKASQYVMMRKHIRTFHSHSSFPCKTCGQTFNRLEKLKKHMLRHSDHREFLCSICGKQFKRKDKLKEHTKRMHTPSEKVLPVKQIGNRTKKKHIPKVSPSEYQRFVFKCQLCMLGFKRRGMLVNHLAKRHPNINPESVPELSWPILKTTRDYFCQYCSKVYKSSSKRKSHILKAHPGRELPPSTRNKDSAAFSQFVGRVETQPHNCTWCHKQYASKAKLLQHQRKTHGINTGPLIQNGADSNVDDVEPKDGDKGEIEDSSDLKKVQLKYIVPDAHILCIKNNINGAASYNIVGDLPVSCDPLDINNASEKCEVKPNESRTVMYRSQELVQVNSAENLQFAPSGDVLNATIGTVSQPLAEYQATNVTLNGTPCLRLGNQILIPVSSAVAIADDAVVTAPIAVQTIPVSGDVPSSAPSLIPKTVILPQSSPLGQVDGATTTYILPSKSTETFSFFSTEPMNSSRDSVGPSMLEAAAERR